ncbi:hypothetical protein ISS04_03635 [Candidatus Woesearchaeota archaeon]|nr:hypothetical protein [Candidatus Woesearchaeota archaeon]
MSKKKILSGRGGEKIEKKELNEILQLEIGFVAILLVFGVFAIFSSLFGAMSPETNLAGQASTICTDSDAGIAPMVKGITKGTFNQEEATMIDECVGDTLIEYYCDFRECPRCINYKEITCPTGSSCNKGICS